jgi:hypothetical protein
MPYISMLLGSLRRRCVTATRCRRAAWEVHAPAAMPRQCHHSWSLQCRQMSWGEGLNCPLYHTKQKHTTPSSDRQPHQNERPYTAASIAAFRPAYERGGGQGARWQYVTTHHYGAWRLLSLSCG